MAFSQCHFLPVGRPAPLPLVASSALFVQREQHVQAVPWAQYKRVRRICDHVKRRCCLFRGRTEYRKHQPARRVEEVSAHLRDRSILHNHISLRVEVHQTNDNSALGTADVPRTLQGLTPAAAAWNVSKAEQYGPCAGCDRPAR